MFCACFECIVACWKDHKKVEPFIRSVVGVILKCIFCSPPKSSTFGNTAHNMMKAKLLAVAVGIVFVAASLQFVASGKFGDHYQGIVRITEILV